MKTVTIGILSQEEMRARALAIAQGQVKPKPGDPKIWFTSMRSLAEVLSDDNRALLKIMRQTQPDSIASLARQAQRRPGNLSRTLKTMANYGLVEMQPGGGRQMRPVAKAVNFKILAS